MNLLHYVLCRACRQHLARLRWLRSLGLLGGWLWAAVAGGGELFRDRIYDVQVQSNVVYGQGSIGNPPRGKPLNLQLDIYRPTDLGGLRPAVVLVHGGGFTVGDKADMSQLALSLASRGYLVTSINYRLTGDNPTMSEVSPNWPRDFIINPAVADTLTSLRWLRSHASELGVDPSRIALGGFSAGAITSLFVGYEEFGDDASVGAVLDFAGGMYDYEHLVDGQDPPLFIVHGTMDSEVSWNLADALAQQARAVSLPYQQFSISGGHEMFLGKVVERLTIDQHAANFLYRHLDAQRAQVVRTGQLIDLIPVGDTWRWHPGTSEPSPFPELGWTKPDFDDDSWKQSPEGFGYPQNTAGRGVQTQLADMKGNYNSIYLRHDFSVSDLAEIDALVLELDYSDAFIAYVNGVEVARNGIGSPDVAAPIRSSAARPNSLPFPLQVHIDLQKFPGLLRVGQQNVLAIQGINRGATSNSFVMSHIRLATTAIVPEPSLSASWSITLAWIAGCRRRRRARSLSTHPRRSMN